MWPALCLVVTAASAAGLWHFSRRAERWQRKAAQFQRELGSARQSHEAETAEARANQQAVFNSMVEGLLILDVAGRIRFANPTAARLLGAGRDLTGATLLEATRRHELQDVAIQAQHEGRVTGFEFQLSAADGGRILQVNAACLRDPGREFAGVVLVLHDLTRLKQLEAMRQEFVANVSHELRTPLSLIKGFVETLLDGARGDPVLLERFLRTIEKHADRLTLLIEDLLAISSLESGQVAMHLHALNLADEGAQVCSELSARASERRVVLHNEISETLSVKADADRLQQVLFNLVDNAIKYGREGGHVRLGARPLGNGFVEGWVADDGPGVPPEAGERVFERFFRVDRARSRDQGGTGLGLSIVKHIIQAHGGEVRLVSQMGKGATFLFTLPAA